ncbi:MAG: RlmE family RNA methyltransferase [Candidatus Binatia bacterium]
MTYQPKDPYYARAKAAGYRSRAAYKLLELSRRYELIKRGDHVVDLGAWPGGWLQVAAQLTGPPGRVLGVDLQPITPLGQAYVSTIVGDVREPQVQEELRAAAGGRIDVVLSDLAPKLSGVRDRDIARSTELAEQAFDIARRLLSAGGRFLLKVFTAQETDALAAAARQSFAVVKLTKPEASRKASSELYLVCKAFKADRPRAAAAENPEPKSG